MTCSGSRLFLTEGRFSHQAARRLSFSRARAGARYPGAGGASRGCSARCGPDQLPGLQPKYRVARVFGHGQHFGDVHSPWARPLPRTSQLRHLTKKVEPERSAKRYRCGCEEPPKDMAKPSPPVPILHFFTQTERIFTLPP